MNDTVNSDGNLFGRFVALVLIAGVMFAAHRLAGSGVTVSSAPVAQEAKPVEAPKARKAVRKPLPLETALPSIGPLVPDKMTRPSRAE